VLNLAIDPQVSHQNILDLNGTSPAEFLELMRVEIGS
jgi:hypothetical protein